MHQKDIKHARTPARLLMTYVMFGDNQVYNLTETNQPILLSYVLVKMGLTPQLKSLKSKQMEDASGGSET